MAWLNISTGSPAKRSHLDRVARALLGVGLSMVLAAGTSAADPELLPPEEAFRFSARALNDRTLEARFAVADGYYLYREKLKFAVEPEIAGLAVPQLPSGKFKEDQFFGKVETYRGDLVVKLPLPAAASGQSLILTADSQGCADLGVCYPVNRQKVTLVVPAAGKGPGAVVEAHPRKKSWFN
jgi:thioredoxin:protein disulfide reductase